MVLSNLELVEPRKVHLIRIDHEIEHLPASFAFKMPVNGGVGIVANFVVFDIDHKGNSFRNKQFERVVNGCSRQGRNLWGQVVVDHVHRWMIVV